MKVFSRLLMLTLFLSVFAGCKKDDDKDESISGTYEGTILVTEFGQTIPDVAIDVVHSGNTISVTIPAGKIPILPIPINASCSVTSNGDKYSLSGTVTVPIMEGVEVSVTVEDSSNITKAGKAVLNMKVKFPTNLPEEIPAELIPEGTPETLNVKFEGQKK
jgi:hypothetical protein